MKTLRINGGSVVLQRSQSGWLAIMHWRGQPSAIPPRDAGIVTVGERGLWGMIQFKTLREARQYAHRTFR